MHVEKEHVNRNSREKQLQIVSLSSSPFKLPDDWLVDERRRISDPTHIDRYYIEPHTGMKFRSLVSVQRYLSEETRDYLPTKRMISENKVTTYTKSRTAKKSLSTRDFEGGINREANACRATPKLVFKCGSGKRIAQSTHSEKTDSQKKNNTGEDDRGSVHNLTRPPTKVSWVLAGPGGLWNPFLDDSLVPESEKLKWSKAFITSINEGVTS